MRLRMRAHWPSEDHVVNQVIDASLGRVGGRGVVERQHAVGELGIDLPDVRLERLHRVDAQPAGEERSFVAVHAGDKRHVVLSPAGIHLERIVGDRPAVDVRGPDVPFAAERAPGVGIRGFEDVGGVGGAHVSQHVVTFETEGSGDTYALCLG